MWLAERVWEPQLARVLSEAGSSTVLVDDHHFALAGHDADALSGYYLTEEQGVRPARLSDQPAPALPDSVRRRRRDARISGNPATTGDGDHYARRREKFGVWPGTYKHVYEDGWLDRFSIGSSRRAGSS
jgi:alpha-amylase